MKREKKNINPTQQQTQAAFSIESEVEREKKSRFYVNYKRFSVVQEKGKRLFPFDYIYYSTHTHTSPF
jgi:hypothetical protein